MTIEFALNHLIEFYTLDRLLRNGNVQKMDEFVDKAIEELPNNEILLRKIQSGKMHEFYKMV